MISETLAYWTIGAPELMLILLYCVVLLPPIIYVIHAIKVRRRILGQLEKLTQEVRLLREQRAETERANE